MRIFGHPLHVMLIHFPVALWPAHGGLHFFAARLPADAGATAAFWLLTAGVVLGWAAAFAGAADLIALARENSPKLRAGFIHAAINGSVLIAFTVIGAMEYPRYPNIVHTSTFLISEGALLVAMIAGNYFGGRIVWAGR